MAIPILTGGIILFLGLTFLAWRRYLQVSGGDTQGQADSCPFSLTEVPGAQHRLNVPHQQGVQWLTEVFSRSAEKFPGHTALQIPHTGESLSYAELDARAEAIAAALSPFLTGPDQVVAVAMEQDNWQIVASHLGILKAGGAFMFLDSSLPEALIAHMLEDARPVVVLTRGHDHYRGLPTLDVLALPAQGSRRRPPSWLDDPAQRLASLFYTSGTTGMPKGVECTHAGYVNLAMSYADYFDLLPGMDATSLCSSLGYDGSISEMYSAWVSGCAVVMLTRDQVRSGPDLVPVLRDAEVTVLFCPPVLLTTLTASPELDLPYPLCRYVVPAGEAFPAALVEPWTRGRRQLINTYGPTEASTDTSRQSLRPGEPVTIGSPFANVTYAILGVDQLEPLPHGEAGELCIGGVHVARGYRNLPEMTARKFIAHPRFGRLYRTGDLCRIDARTQRVHFLGRIDTQLKVRGHRVEVQAVEDILQTQFREIETAVLDYQNQELVAFVVAPSISGGDPQGAVAAPAEWAAGIRAALFDQLPEPSVPSRIFLVDAFVMKPASGKIDRGRLPSLSRLRVDGELEGAAAGNGGPPGQRDAGMGPTRRPGADGVLAICQDVFESPLGWDDVFIDHGGHSIIIAQLAERLHAAGWTVPVRALLSDSDTPRKVADRPPDPVRIAAIPAATEEPAQGHIARDAGAAKILGTAYFTTLQLLFLALLYAPHLIGFLALVAFGEIGEFFMTAQLWQFIAVGLLLYLFTLGLPFANLLWVLLIKLCMGGHIYRNRVEAGVYPKWSRMHLRIWCIERLESSVLRPLRTMFRSAPLMAYVLRRLGASVGANLHCAHDVEFSAPLDLLSIGEGVAIQTGAYISMSMWVGSELHVGPVNLGRGSKIGMRAAVANGVTVGRGAWILPLTPILGDVGEQEMWEGAPARFSGQCTELKRTADRCVYAWPLWLLESCNSLMQLLLDFLLLVAPTALVAWFAATLIPGSETALASDYFRVTPMHDIVWHLGLYAFATTWFTSVLISVLGCLFLRSTAASPGLYPSRGLKSALLLYRVKMMNEIQRLWTWTITGQYLRALAGLRFTRLGASECDVMLNLVPELAVADSHVFWAQGCFTNMLDQGAEHIKLRQLEMPTNFFCSNNCVAEAGHFPTNFLLGVSTPVSDINFRLQMRSRVGEPITVAGNPPLRFASADFAAEKENSRLPGFGLFLARVLLNDILGMGALRIADVLAYAIVYTVLLRMGGDVLWSALLSLFLAEFGLIVSCAAVKKLLVGSRWGVAHSAPFWSWRHFTYFFAQDCFFAWCRIPLRVLAGTLLPNTILRLMGCRLGKRTLFTWPLQAFDWNAVDFGDDCMIGGLLQFHSFENLTLKVKKTNIGDGSVVNVGATVMGGAVLEPGTTLLPLSLVLKEMHLPAGVYEGSPSGPVSEMDSQALRGEGVYEPGN